MTKWLCLLVFLTSSQYVFCKTKYYYLKPPEKGDTRFSVVKANAGNSRDFVSSWEEGVTARSLFSQDINQTGWAFIEVHSNNAYSDEVQAYSAGYIEGYLTFDLIYMHYLNTLGDFCKNRDELCKKVDDFISTNLEWVKMKIESSPGNDLYWHQVKLFYKQLEGLVDGYNRANNGTYPSLSHKNLLWLNMNGDFEDLQQMFSKNNNKYGKASGNGHCSALIKLLPDGKELFVSQDTWSSYESMLRFQKKYILPYLRCESCESGVPGVAMTFSSYPGVITSGDDFYVISSGLVTLETTIGNDNSSLWKYIVPKGTVLEGVRSTVANRLASSGEEWSSYFSKFNSGTYNNQWMVVDYKKFKVGTPAERLQPGLLWVVEQLPGYIEYRDMTKILSKQTYWPSYNVAAFKSIFTLSGNQELVDKYGDWFTYERNPRALIFKRDHDKVVDLDSMFKLMRYNDFKHDPLSQCNCTPPYSAENSIAARCDLNPANGTYPFEALGHRPHGATDAKITSMELFQNGLQFLAVSGPIYNEERGIPPFQWSKSDYNKKLSHVGLPDLWKFEPAVHKWA